jgi:hypothetical protein
MPNGEFRFSRNTVLSSAVPSSRRPRSSVMRLALGVAGAGALHRLLLDVAAQALVVVGLGRRVRLGDEDVAVRQHVQPARMVEAGRVRAHRDAVAGDRPGALAPACAGAMWTVGSSVLFGGGRRGVGPVPALTGKVAVSPQPASASAMPRETRRTGFFIGVTEWRSRRLCAPRAARA